MGMRELIRRKIAEGAERDIEECAQEYLQADLRSLGEDGAKFSEMARGIAALLKSGEATTAQFELGPDQWRRLLNFARIGYALVSVRVMDMQEDEQQRREN